MMNHLRCDGSDGGGGGTAVMLPLIIIYVLYKTKTVLL